MEISIVDDFDLQKIAQSGQCFRVREFEDGTFRFVTGDEVLYIKKISSDLFEISCDEATWNDTWIPYFDLERCYLLVREAISSSDPYLHQAAKEGQGIRILRQEPWETLVTFIISQRKSIPAIKNSVELLAKRFGTVKTTPYETLYTFPTALQMANADVQDLMDCKLGYRAPYVLDAISQATSGSLDLAAIAELSDTELLHTLKTIRGVGDKVAHCICLFAYGRLGLAPVDTWIHKIIAQEYGGVNPFPAYGTSAGIMQQYAFYHAISHKERFTNGSSRSKEVD
jgi:N-glycosylase/DNA lyase